MGRSFTSLADDEFNRLFLDFRYTAYRLETLQRYEVSYEQAEFDRFLAGEARGEFPGIADWIGGTVTKAVSAGKRMHRVHVVQEPLSDYVRFECAWAYEHTSRAGEEIRIISVARDEWPAGLPKFDYWLFDSSQLVAMYYEDDGKFISAEIVDDPKRVVQANYWRDAAVEASIPYREFASPFDPQFRNKQDRSRQAEAIGNASA
ncbi:DUF6879 family protein [Saccharopolyspora phatthalungensis]|uniref:DUF6879 domain-containing protein n=1 Tax=Saccharopolyspora phatthalungensis TaxID=664693 RepID=A0A840QHD3_9PSEU|nr:DUF6879 family protein [Saccharopolyspora phatthalungensis]MBB5159561.1 hypothetical protein [Saccharopolyspora phatthalungensis]